MLKVRYLWWIFVIAISMVFWYISSKLRLRFYLFIVILHIQKKKTTKFYSSFSIVLSFQRDVSSPVFRVVIVYIYLWTQFQRFSWSLMFMQNSPVLLRNSCVQCIATGKQFPKFLTICKKKLHPKNVDGFKWKLDLFIVLSRCWYLKS